MNFPSPPQLVPLAEAESFLRFSCTFVICSVSYEHIVTFRLENHFRNFWAFFEDLLILILQKSEYLFE